MEEGPGIRFIEEGFKLIDRCLDWCEKHSLYVFLDLHGAPGGQTGANIDDSIDDMPRLFMDKDSYDKGIALWVGLAERYKDRTIVGGYDLLNEPIRTVNDKGSNIDHYLSALSRFYKDCIKEIRKIDKNHLFSLEGHHWSTRLDIFDHLFDESMCIHFHRYWNPPEPSLLADYIEAGKRLDVPLWLGETGENTVEWFVTMFHMLDQHEISWNFWPWKKMATVNSPCSIEKPESFGTVLDYIKGGQHPGFEQAQEIFDGYLHNMKTENCTYNDIVVKQLLRTKGCHVPALSYDTKPGIGESFSGLFKGDNEIPYRKDDKMRFIGRLRPDKETRGDNPWQEYDLLLSAGEWADYTINASGDGTVTVCASLRPCACGSVIEVFVNGEAAGLITVEDGKGSYLRDLCIIGSGAATSDETITVRIKSIDGAIALETLHFS